MAILLHILFIEVVLFETAFDHIMHTNAEKMHRFYGFQKII